MLRRTAPSPVDGRRLKTPMPSTRCASASDSIFKQRSGQERREYVLALKFALKFRRSRGARRPGNTSNLSLRRQRAQGRPGTGWCPWSACRKKSTRQNHRLSRGYPAFPAQWFYGLYVLFPVTGLFCHRHSWIVPTNLAPASGRQNHTISPSAIASFVAQKIAPDATASIASRFQRP